MRVEIFQEWGQGWTSKTPIIVFLNKDISTLFLDYFNKCVIASKEGVSSSCNYFCSSMRHAESSLKINYKSENLGAILRKFYLKIGQNFDLTLPTELDTCQNPEETKKLSCNIMLPDDVEVVLSQDIIERLQRFGAVIQTAHHILIQGNTFLLKDLWMVVLGYLTSNDHIEMVTTVGESKISFFASFNNKDKEKSENILDQTLKI